MKRELESSIDEINRRIGMNYNCRAIKTSNYGNNNMTQKKSFSCHPKSMSQLRSYLKKTTQRVMNLFPDLYQEKLEDIQRAFMESRSGSVPFSQLWKLDKPSQHEDEMDHQNEENNTDGEKDRDIPNSITLHPLKFASSNKRIPKWKSIWNGIHPEYYKSQAITNIELFVRCGRQPQYRIWYTTWDQLFSMLSTTLENIYYFLPRVTTKERHEIMFEKLKFQALLRSSKHTVKKEFDSNVFSSICYVAYRLKSRTSTTPSNFIPTLEKLIFFFLKECREFNGSTKQLLMHEWIPNNCSLSLLLRIRHVDFEPVLIRILREYAREIRTCSPQLLAYIIDSICSTSDLNVPKYLIIIAQQQIFDTHDRFYFSQVFNMMIRCLNHSPFPMQFSKTVNSPTLSRLEHPKNNKLNALLHDFKIPPDEKDYDERNTFFKQLRTILGSTDKKARELDELEPLEHYGSFNKPKFLYH
ncbi:hypothetical protein C9374_001356 [Naegleria lovaniensis]|uniref:Uncharacterized protein n=1 Tax=Naegleria lovaniensis TaxID=51637 RepID=A0AA88KS49_NAELO|nr:uncharacterized protein C9374_001356 [Naegleria lovaniensis]KAG2387762.1 hypothetical protein C9374_001356 [Naegleria lovaniensis]